jgi:hypothetical protein
VLAPHFEAIRHWRRQRRTWKEIAALLQSEKGIVVTLHAPYRFMRRRLARGRHWEDPRDESPVTPSSSASIPSAEPSAGPSAKPAPDAAKARSIPALPSNGFQKPDRQSFNPDAYL